MSVESEVKNKPLDELGKMLKTVTDLYNLRKSVGDEREIIAHEKKELDKALNCICSLIKLIETENLSLEQSFREALDLIQGAWQYPDETAARISYDNNVFTTGNFIVETEWRHEAEIKLDGQSAGKFEVFYMEKTPEEFDGLLMWERQQMVDAFALGLGLIIARFKADEKRETLKQVIEQARQTEKKYAAKIARNLPKLKKIKQMADESILATNRFLAATSKEMLGALDRIIESINRHEKGEAPDDSGWQTIKATTKHITQITKQISDYADIETKPFRQNNGEFNLRILIEQIIDPLHRKARAKGIDLINFTNPLIPEILVGDSEKIKTILTNLIDNAINRTSKGEIAVGVELEATPHLLPIFHFTVADSGDPIYEENIVRTFEPFEKEKGESSAYDIHCRLGRAISKKLVEFMGGEIWVENCFHYEKENHPGTTIHFTMWMDILSKQKMPNILAMMEESTVRALVVEKNNVYKNYFSILLSNAGVDPHFVDDYDHAVSLLKSRKFNPEAFSLAILRDGYEALNNNALTEYCRKLDHAPCMRMIGISENNLPQSVDDNSQVCVFIEKPISALDFFELIQKTVHQYLDNKKTQEAAPQETPVDDSWANETSPIPIPTLQKTESSSAQESPAIRILLADRSDSKRVILEKLLAKRNYGVTLFLDGREALDRVRSGEFDMLIIDVDTPIIGGLEVIKMVREWEKQNNALISIIAVTNDKNEIDCKMCFEAGADECLPVNENIKDILSGVERLYQLRNSNTQQQEDETEQQISGEINFDGITRFDSDAALKNVDGDADMLIELLDIFADDSRTLVAEADNILSSGNIEATPQALRELEKAAAAVGARSIVMICQHMQSTAKNGDSNSLKEGFNRLSDEIAAFNREARIFEQSCQQQDQSTA
ncbi:MAG: ATP-binding protein [Candidatus Zixiibacteriota bacterium]